MKKQYKFALCIALLGLAVMTLDSRAQVYAPIPYSTGFETGALDASWTTASSAPSGQVALFTSGTLTFGGLTAYSHSGTYYLGLHHPTPGGFYVTNEARLHLNTAGQSGLRISFWWAEWNDETEPLDGVYISDNGGTTFTKVLDLNGASYNDLQWYNFNLSLDSINTIYGLNFTSTYVIKFQQYDNYYFAGGNDGFLFDDISVYGTCPNSASSISPVVCSQYTVPSGDETYTASGVYHDTLPNAAGCDSIITINLTVGNTAVTVNQSGCDQVVYNSVTYTTSGTHVFNLTTTGGCDSVVTLNVTVGTDAASTTTVEACGSYPWTNGINYTQSGTYTQNLLTSLGCDSIATLQLTINAITSSTITVDACDEFTWTNGNTYTQSGTYTQLLTSAQGCDSVVTLQLTVTPSPVMTVTSANGINLQAPGSAATYQWIDCSTMQVVSTAGSTYPATANGSYAVIGTSAAGCADTSDCYSVVAVGIEANDAVSFNLFPNPSEGPVTMDLFLPDALGLQLEIIDISGRSVMSRQLEGISGNNVFYLDFSSLAKGIYELRLSHAYGQASRKIILE